MTGHTHKRLLAIGITIALLAGSAWGEERTWTDTTGKFSVTAELVEVRGDKVVLRRQNGKQVTVPLAKLSAEDRQFLTQHTAENPFTERQSLPVPQARSLRPPLAVAPFDSRQAKAHQKAWADHLGIPVQITNRLGMKLNLIPPGEFAMGSPTSEADRGGDETQHRVKITKPFYLSVHEVTQAQYEAVVGNNPSNSKGDTKPVEMVNWDEAVAFCGKLSDEEGMEYRLPTEAEWEYACRAGTTTTYSFGDDASRLGEYAWYAENSEYTTHPVGGLKPNAWGLYDMHGNVAEWCRDWWAPYGNEKAVSDPTGPASGEYRVLRGGAFYDQPMYVRAADRLNYYVLPDDRNLAFGFRLARTYALSP